MFCWVNFTLGVPQKFVREDGKFSKGDEKSISVFQISRSMVPELEKWGYFRAQGSK
jgi:hypothetical protein